MTTIPSHLSSVGPSPSRNPFARPKLGGNSSSSFTRKTLLPSILSPVKPSPLNEENGLVTPSQKTVDRVGGGSTSKARSAWRLLWRGGLEIGNEGWRLDGITFFALLSFPPPTPSYTNKEINPFDVPIQPFPFNTPGPSNVVTTPGGGGLQSPFPLTNGDTDLCLSLESMRGRRYLQVRGLIDLPSEEILEGESIEDENNSTNNIQMSISSKATLLSAYFTGLLCRNEKLSKKGRTLNAILIGLGDEGIDSSNNSTILVYGQKQDTTSEGGQGILKLCVGRRKPPPPPPSAKKVKPGEPLPRAPLFFPAKAPKKPPPLFPSRSLSRTSSISSSIYQAPQSQSQSQFLSHPEQGESSQQAQSQSHAPVSGRTPGRRGEKRPRKLDLEDEEERQRKSGKIVPRSNSTLLSKMERSKSGDDLLTGQEPVANNEEEEEEEEDIFGKRSKSTPIPLLMSRTKSTESNGFDKTQSDDNPLSEGYNVETNSINKIKRIRVPQQVLDNKASIRKQTLVLLENRGISRSNDLFKDVFGMITKGTYFAFRDRLQIDQISKIDIHKIINIHLDMYLPTSLLSLLNQDIIMENDKVDEDENEDEDLKPEKLVKLEQVKKEEYAEVQLEGTFLQKIHQFDSKTRIKLESVVEEEED